VADDMSSQTTKPGLPSGPATRTTRSRIATTRPLFESRPTLIARRPDVRAGEIKRRENGQSGHCISGSNCGNAVSPFIYIGDAMFPNVGF
jgi:hypothetical protein